MSDRNELLSGAGNNPETMKNIDRKVKQFSEDFDPLPWLFTEKEHAMLPQDLLATKLYETHNNSKGSYYFGATAQEEG